jgi:hypothetical protein
MSKTWRNNANGRTVRRRKGPSLPFVQLFKWMIDSPAWRSLSGEEVAAFIEIARRYNGTNNGTLHISARELAARRGLHWTTAAKVIRGLVDKGFLEIVRGSGFNMKRVAAEYRLTTHHCDVTRTPPSKAFMRWSPKP